MTVGVQSDDRLQQRCCQLIGQRDETNLPEVEGERILEQGID